MPITINDFSVLAVTEQLNLLYVEGIYLTKRREKEYSVLLYQLDSLYVEIFYKKYRQTILKINCSDKTDILDPYLEEINIETIFE